MLDTGRRWVGPTGDIIERQDPVTGDRFLVLVLQDPYPRLPSIRAAMDVGRSFLEQPLVDGVVALVSADSEQGTAVYDVRDMLLLAPMLDDLGPRDPPGPRAAATLGTLATAILIEAAESGEISGVFCHGDVSPWRVLIGTGGEVGLIGYGIPEPETCRMRHTGSERPMVPALNWTPPERIAGRPEDVRSDLYSLAMVCAEFATGTPLLSGAPDVVYQAARAGHARERLSKPPFSTLPAPLLRHLRAMLAPSPSERPGPNAWADAWIDVLHAMPAGPELADLGHDVARRWDERARVGMARPLSEATNTRMTSLATLGRILERRRVPLPITHDPVAPLPIETSTWRPTEPAPVEIEGAPRRVEAPERPVRRAPPSAAKPEPSPARPILTTPKRAAAPQPHLPTPEPDRPILPHDAPTPATAPQPAPDDAPRRAPAPERPLRATPTSPAPVRPVPDDTPRRLAAAPAPAAQPAPDDTPRRAPAPERPARATPAPKAEAAHAPSPPGAPPVERPPDPSPAPVEEPVRRFGARPPPGHRKP